MISAMDMASGGPPANPSAIGPAFPPFQLLDGDPASGLLFLCDHASNALPPAYGSLGLSQGELDRHIGYDIGAAAVTRELALRLGSPAVLSTFSRLLIDPNRGEDDPTLIMRLSDGAVVPGNAAVDAAERERRIRRFHRPYHDAVAAAVERGLHAGRPPALISIHSFTPIWRGSARRWHAGILWDRDDRLAAPLIAALAADPELVVGDNEPYSGSLANDTLFRHGTRHGLAHVLIEIRQDLIADEDGARAWAVRLGPILAGLNGLRQIHEVAHFGSRSGPVGPI
jgi:predicted N-formylglutamate amidohydrolase